MPRKREHNALPQDEDDNISLTSTVDSEHSSDHEFIIDRILAEKIEGKKKKYLIFWEGYPEERASWEPSDNIPPGISNEWKSRKESESTGRMPKFDVDGFERRKDEIQQKKEHRQQWRQTERQRRRNLVLEDEESDEEIRGPIRRKPTSTESGEDSTKKPQKPLQKSRVEPHNTARPSSSGSNAMSLSDSDVPLGTSLSTRNKNILKPQVSSGSDSDTQLASQRIILAKVVAPTILPAGAAAQNVQGKENKPSERGMKATRGQSSIGRNVFASTGTIRKRPNLLENSSNPAKDPKHYRNFHIIRKAELAARDKADAAPKDPSVLDLFDPAHPTTFKPSRPTIVHTSSNAAVPQTNPRSVIPEASRPPTKKEQVCYFYHLKQGKDNACSKGYMCDYSHDLSRNLPVASAPGAFISTKPKVIHELAGDEPEPRVEPESDVEPETRNAPEPLVRVESRVGPANICYFWANSTCTKSACRYYHEWREGYSVADPPLNTNYNAICWFYYTRGSCNRGRTCKYLHSTDTSRYEVSPNPNPVPESTQTARPPYEPYYFSPNATPAIAQPERQDFEPYIPAMNTNVEEEQALFIPGDQPDEETNSRDRGTRTKLFTFGRNDEEQIRFTLGDIDQSHPWVQHLDSLDKIRLNETCMAQDFRAMFNNLECRHIWGGSLVPVGNPIRVGKICQDLILLSSALIATLATSIQSHHKLLIYPNADNSWSGLNPNQNGVKTALNYYVFESLPWPASTEPSKSVLPEIARESSSLTRLSETIKSVLSTPAEPNTAPDSSSEIIDVINIISVKDAQKTSQAYFFIFPPTSRELFETMAKMLIQRDGKIYSSESEGSWLSFVDDPSSQHLTVLVHRSMASEICDIPKLQQLLRKKSNPRVFFISEASPHEHISSRLDRPSLQRITADRIFPHGACILLTPSFLTTSPDSTLRVLEWFFGKFKHGRIETGSSKLQKATRGTYKLVVCHGFLDYLSNLANAKAIERDRFMERNHNDPSKDYKASQMGLSYDNCHTRFRVQTYVTELYSAGLLGSVDDSLIDYYHGIADEDASPIMFADPSIDADDEPALVSWFAGYAAMKLQDFRKFVVLGGPIETSRLREVSASKSRDEAMDENIISELRRAEAIAARLSASKVRDAGSTLEIDSIPKEEWETVKFEPTLKWYQRMGSPWNHISVDNYQVQLGYLNVLK